MPQLGVKQASCVLKKALNVLAHPPLLFEGWGAFGETQERGTESESVPSGYEQVARLLRGCEKREYLLGDVPGLQLTF